MPVAAADGALGIEARHVWNGLTLNDLTVWPRYRLRRIRGLHDLPDSDDNREPKTEQIGEIVYPSYARGKTVTYEGEVIGKTLQELRAGSHSLRSAFGPDIATGLNPERRMVIVPHPTYGTQQHTFQGQCRLCTVEDEQTQGPTRQLSPFIRAFVIDIRLADPRLYLWDGTTATSARW